jgi:hypothetical protein
MFTKNPAQNSTDKSSESSLPDTEVPNATELARKALSGNLESVVASKASKNISDAVDKVVLLYSFARQTDVYEFIQHYTKRPIASFIDIFGTSDLQIEKVETLKTRLVRLRVSLGNVARSVGAFAASTAASTAGLVGVPVATGSGTAAAAAGYVSKYTTKTVEKEYKETSYKVTQGQEGFHSRAFSDEDNLFGLAQPNVQKILGLNKKDSKLLSKMDTRLEKREQVRVYLADLLNHQGIPG